MTQRRDIQRSHGHHVTQHVDRDDGPDDGPTDAYIERFSGVTQRCPKCNTELHDDVEICWSCGTALRDGTITKGPAWWVYAAVVIVVVLAILRWSTR